MNIIQGSFPHPQTSQVIRVKGPGNAPPQKTPEQDKNGEPQTPTTKAYQGSRLTQDQIRILNKLKQTDMEVRQHEMAHISAGAGLITSGMNLTYQRGPDGKNYAVAGEVQIDTSPVPGDPQATLEKMKQVKAAALAPANPSSQDQTVAASAAAEAAKASSELLLMRTRKETKANEQKAFGPLLQERDRAYAQVNAPPDASPSFQTRA